MKQLFTTIILLWFLSIGSASCSPDDKQSVVPPTNEQPDENNNDNNPTVNEKINIKIGDTFFTATLHDNATAKAFRSLLPLTATMSEHAGNEKYYNLPKMLPVDVFQPGTIETGDLMLWGSDCLVLFYETFSSSYSYTRMGKIDDPSDLTETVGSGSVTVIFE